MNEKQRMRGDDRRELILVAATRVFGDYGYFGTTTAQVAKAAGVSQPYVVRVFGTKQQLFLDVLERALDLLMTAFRAVRAVDSPDSLAHRIGVAYVELAAQHGLLLSLMHGFVLGREPEIGAAARRGFLCVYRFLRQDAGFSAEETREFLSGGMLINTLVGLRMIDDYDSDPEVRELMQTAMPEKLDIVLALRDREAE